MRLTTGIQWGEFFSTETIRQWLRRNWVITIQLAIFSIPPILAATISYDGVTYVHDAKVFREVPFEMIRQNELIVRRDAPIRYFPPFIAYLLLDPGWEQAGRITIGLAGLWFYILIGAALYAMFSSYRNRAAGIFATLIFVFLHFYGVTYRPVISGSYQFAYALPYMIVTLVVGWKALQVDTVGGRIRWAAATGAVSALTANIELYCWFMGTVPLGIAWLRHKRYHDLAIAGMVGLVGLIPFLFVPNQGPMFEEQFARVLYDGGAIFTLRALEHGLRSFDLYLGVLLLGGMLFFDSRGYEPPGGTVTTSIVLVSLTFILLDYLTTLKWILTHQYYLVTAVIAPAAVLQVLDVFREHDVFRHDIRRLEWAFSEYPLYVWAPILFIELAFLLLSAGGVGVSLYR